MDSAGNTNKSLIEVEKDEAFELIVPTLLSEVPGLVCGFTTRRGGVSPAPWDSLNLSMEVSDERENVVENRRRLLSYLRWNGRFLIPHQVHGSKVALANGDLSNKPEADALVGFEGDTLLGVMVADCVPILMTKRNGKAFGCVHAGWRGTAQGIASKALQYLANVAQCGAEEVLISIGPSIGPCCYEVDPPVVSALNSSYSGGNLETRHVDLQEINRRQLLAAGVSDVQIEIIRTCTSCALDKCFSFRRDRGQTGRMMGFIGKAA